MAQAQMTFSNDTKTIKAVVCINALNWPDYLSMDKVYYVVYQDRMRYVIKNDLNHFSWYSKSYFRDCI